MENLEKLEVDAGKCLENYCVGDSDVRRPNLFKCIHVIFTASTNLKCMICLLYCGSGLWVYSC